MPDILIRGMEMPKGCYFCKLNYHGRGCSITGTMYESDTMVLMDFDEYTQRLKDCPLVELPPHGDLIDRDALLSRGKNNPFVDSEIYHPCVQTNCREIVMDEPVVVPAERRAGDA